MSSQLFDHRGAVVTVGTRIGQGGEGAVYEITSGAGYVAKLYHQPPAKEKANKLTAMIGISRPELIKIAAWPVATLHKVQRGPVVGLVMPKVADGKEIHTLYSPAHRKAAFPSADWGFLIDAAISCADAFNIIHQVGAVIGDVNQSSVFITNNHQARLIDCDSFQVRANGTTFYCDVGVPLFTPPELQNLSFRGLARTENHDLFGLAVLIFQLLFMGRHPYSGRFLGKGDMPIETAISQHRFAYGRNASQMLMQPPPHTLPISAATAASVALFERAFSNASANGLRPKAAEWVGTLKGLRGSLKQCQADAGHQFANSLSNCPWCELVRGGAPNYFISVAFTRMGGRAAAFDLDAVWRLIGSILLEPRKYKRPEIPAVSPRPLPNGIPTYFPPRVKLAVSQNELIATSVAAANCIIAIPLLFSLTGLGIVFLLASIGFVVWLVVERRARLKEQAERHRERREELGPLLEEIDRRHDAMRLAVNALRDAEMSFNTLDAKHSANYQTKLAELRSCKAEYEKLNRQYTEERAALQANARAKQLEMHMQQHFVSDQKFEGVGRARMAALACAGVDTAFDVTFSSVRAVPGFGDVLTMRVVEWRNEVERRFVPVQGIPASLQQALDMKFYSLRQSIEAKLNNGPIALREVLVKRNQELEQQLAFIRSVLVKYAQANSDVAVLPTE